MGDNLRNRRITFVSGGSKQLEAQRDTEHSHISAHLVPAFYGFDADWLHDCLQHFGPYPDLRTSPNSALLEQHAHVRFAPVRCPSGTSQRIAGEDSINWH